MKKNVVMWTILCLYLLCLISILFLVFVKKPVIETKKVIPTKLRPITKDAIAIVDVSGPIRIRESTKKLWVHDAESIVRRLRSFSERKEVKAIVLRVNSPGGTVAAVQEIYSELMKLRQEKGKVIVTSMGDIATSGAYYVASASDRIIANPGTITGSIGVLLEIGNVQELFKKIGVKVETIKSGRHKDSGSAFRELTIDERKMFQTLIDEAYEQFVNAIVDGRKMEKSAVLQLADGSVWTGSQALRLGLVDKLGNDRTAIEVAKEIAKIKGEPKIITEYEPWERIISILGSSTQSKSPVDELISKNKIRFEYMFE
ncbi:MAG: signal peptide peptidase SppA [Elusimicrobiota bacterium]|nr:signal peptide peptidase SppA [Elusimicrobiota bacterium]